MTYPDDMDPECVPLCDAINAIPGLETGESCSGHGTGPMRVWFSARDVRSLYVLARCTDPRYVGKFCGWWDILAESTDIPERPVIFHLRSVSHGENAYLDARQIAFTINETLANKKVTDMFGIEVSSG